MNNDPSHFASMTDGASLPTTPRRKRRRAVLRDWLRLLFLTLFLLLLTNWLLFKMFSIPTPSMENTLLVGDFLIVSKLHYGARTPHTPLRVPFVHQKFFGWPSYYEGIQLPSWRLPGLTGVRRGDVVVFNFPPDEENGKHYPPDLKTHYIKRCVAIAGDTLEIKAMRLYVNQVIQNDAQTLQHRYRIHTEHIIEPATFAALGIVNYEAQQGGYTVYATGPQVDKLAQLSFVREATLDKKSADQMDTDIYPSHPEFPWNSDNFGPLVIPKKGMTMQLTRRNLLLYAKLIMAYEGHTQIEVRNERLYIQGQWVKRYTFKQDYFFMLGDNWHNSYDSRFWGLVPHDHIVGKAITVCFSVAPQNSQSTFVLPHIRWNRFFKAIR
ncbi:signal peptidase I [Eisenibacter elegans]|jgi:signal peptidase I|uniref:signal peptidase I n=1 Tax=Eisenibacter elegans TaxID=997 RepID=UPI0004115300|nr:signal peptidase I [Eisenibacter elegans]